jgi:hypothetical protein
MVSYGALLGRRHGVGSAAGRASVPALFSTGYQKIFSMR